MDPKDVLLEIVVGTYEKYLLGYVVELSNDLFCLRPSFAAENHLQSVRCIASSNKFIVSGSVDETIQLLNVKTHREIGSLLHHNGTVTCLELHDSYLMSSSEDKTICIWSTKNWQCIKTLKGHKNAVNSISIHPSGKMALSVSKDKTMRTWNLVTGRTAYVTNIKKEADFVKWAPDGSYFVIVCNKTVDIYSVETGTVSETINLDSRICDLAFLNDHLCAFAEESGCISICDIKSGSLSSQFKAHKTRVKAINCVRAKDELFIITISSDGFVKVFHADTSEPIMKFQKVAQVKTGCRPTCVTSVAMQ